MWTGGFAWRRGVYTSDGKTFDTESDPQSAVKMTSIGLCGGLRKTLKIFIGRRGKSYRTILMKKRKSLLCWEKIKIHATFLFGNST